MDTHFERQPGGSATGHLRITTFKNPFGGDLSIVAVWRIVITGVAYLIGWGL